jgi:hypothetical protein
MVMQLGPKIRSTREGWFFAFVFAPLYCWLGRMTASTAGLFNGLESVLSGRERLLLNAGPILFPVLGVGLAVTGYYLSTRCRHRWPMYALFGLSLWGFWLLLGSSVPAFKCYAGSLEAAGLK